VLQKPSGNQVVSGAFAPSRTAFELLPDYPRSKPLKKLERMAAYLKLLGPEPERCDNIATKKTRTGFGQLQFLG